MAKKKKVYQQHHLAYEPEVTRKIRKGCHAAITILNRFNYLEPQEVNALLVTILMKEKFDESI